MHWVFEPQVFSADEAFVEAVQRAGHTLILWNDDWWMNGRWLKLRDERVVFRGSLGNAARVRAEMPWQPGGFCDVEAFDCSAWYPRVKNQLVHQAWRSTTVCELVDNASKIASSLQADSRLFVRPDSPLKPFSGRVVEVEGLTLETLDYGFYYEDKALPVIVAPVLELGPEYRFVLVRDRVIAGSGYLGTDRSTQQSIGQEHEAWIYASRIAESVQTPEAICVLDVVGHGDRYYVLEFNPFSGADLYACNPDDVVQATSAYLGTDPADTKV